MPALSAAWRCRGSKQPPQQGRKTCKERGNRGKAQDHPTIGVKMDDSHLPKPAPQTQGCSTPGDEWRKEMDAVPGD